MSLHPMFQSLGIFPDCNPNGANILAESSASDLKLCFEQIIVMFYCTVS